MKDDLVGVKYVTAEEGAQILDRQARKYLNMSGDEFVRRYRAGQVHDLDHSGVARVSMLLPFANISDVEESA